MAYSRNYRAATPRCTRWMTVTDWHGVETAYTK